MNLNSLIVVADAARARVFRTIPGRSPRAAIELAELDSLAHPEARLREGDRYAGSFPSGVRPGKVGSSHGLDDHRSAHDAEDRRRFVREIAAATAERLREWHARLPGAGELPLRQDQRNICARLRPWEPIRSRRAPASSYRSVLQLGVLM